jgi:NADPH2:quinone reductase
MKSWTIRYENGKAVLEPAEVAKPAAKAGELLVRVRASSLNRGEFIAGHGLHGSTAEPKPAGGEAAGDVEAVGEGVKDFRPGDRVMGRAKGAFAEYAIMNAKEAMLKPSQLAYSEAAAVPLVFLVAYDMLVTQGGLQKGEALLITGVSSGVGVACAQLGKFLGAKVIGTSGSQAKLDKLALDVPINTRKPDFAAKVKEATGGKGANLAVNNVGGSVIPELIKSLAYQGRLAIVGYVDGKTTSEVDFDAVHAQRLKIFGVSNKNRTAEERAANVAAFVKDVLPAFAKEAMKPMIDKMYPMAELPKALAYMETDAHVGKIVVSA